MIRYAQVDHDYSQCRKSLESLESRLVQSSVASYGHGHGMSARDGKVNLDIVTFTPTQRGLFKQISGILNSLVAEKRRRQLKEMRENLSGQQERPFKAPTAPSHRFVGTPVWRVTCGLYSSLCDVLHRASMRCCSAPEQVIHML